jgi:hypothetical protein
MQQESSFTLRLRRCRGAVKEEFELLYDESSTQEFYVDSPCSLAATVRPRASLWTFCLLLPQPFSASLSSPDFRGEL